MEDDPESKGYTVKDRRHSFKEEAEQAEAPPQEPSQDASAGSERERNGDTRRPEPTVLPPVDFATFVFSLNTSALVHLGEIADPSTGKKDKHLILAKHAIDTIGMLYDKTKGNLTKDEQDLIEHVLYDLRMRYVREA